MNDEPSWDSGRMLGPWDCSRTPRCWRVDAQFLDGGDWHHVSDALLESWGQQAADRLIETGQAVAARVTRIRLSGMRWRVEVQSSPQGEWEWGGETESRDDAEQLAKNAELMPCGPRPVHHARVLPIV